MFPQFNASSMKETKQVQSTKLTEADKALLKEVAEKLSDRPTLFPEKVASAKALLKNAQFPPDFPSPKSQDTSH